MIGLIAGIIGGLRQKSLNCAAWCLLPCGLCKSLIWGEETTKIEVGGVQKHFADGGTYSTCDVYSGWSLQGQAEGRHHLIHVDAVMGSGLGVRKWMERFLLAKEKHGVVSGFMFARWDCSRARSSDFKMDIVDRSVWVQNHYPVGIPKEVDVYAQFGASCSFRRGGGRPHKRWLAEAIHSNKWWRNVERVKDKIQSQSIRDRYVEILKGL
jgi:hypothetical protein